MRCATLTRCWASRNRAAVLFELAAALDKDIERPIDQHIGDVVVFEKRFERTQPDHVVGQLGGERSLLHLVELDALLGRDLADQLGDLRPAGCGARMRPATEGSMRDISAVRICSFSSSRLASSGRRARRLLAGNEDELVAARLDDAAAEPGRPHFSALHQRRRSGGRPDISSARAAIASANLPRCAAAILVAPATVVNNAG